ncbi:MAG: LTA synthase family protein [Lachnospiraceae bacterium]|nr:LTA synthase family protein [Lachnospiraceae bacterium]
MLLFYLTEGMLHNPFRDLSFGAQAYNLFFMEAFFCLLLFLTGSFEAAKDIQSACLTFFMLANFYVLRFRSKPVLPADLFSLKTAASVADNYDYTPSFQVVSVCMLILLLNVAASFYYRAGCVRKYFGFLRRQSGERAGEKSVSLPDLQKVSKEKLSLKRRVFGGLFSFAALGAALFLIMIPPMQKVLGFYTRPYTPDRQFRHNGYLLSYCQDALALYVSPPEGYSKEAAESLLQQQKGEGGPAPQPFVSGKPVNLVIMMNEAFSDLTLLGEFPVNEDPIPFAHSLMEGKEGVFTGILHVSVLGGNTANTEFEVLTGHSMAFLPDGTIPYQQYLKNDTESLASILNGYGYHSLAMHPYLSTGWHRNEAYPLMGFQEMRFLDSFEEPEYLRHYVDDRSCVREIEKLFESKDEAPLFVFNVTMQNHSSFIEGHENLQENIHTGLPEAEELDRYLSLLQYSDASFKELTEYFRDYREPVLLVFFGDHQPGLSVTGPILKANGKDPAYLEDEDLRTLYEVPVFLWTNYEEGREQGLDISANFLGNEILSHMGIPLTPYRNFLEETRQKYRSISTQGLVTANGEKKTLGEGEADLSDYKILQYYGLLKGGIPGGER